MISRPHNIWRTLLRTLGLIAVWVLLVGVCTGCDSRSPQSPAALGVYRRAVIGGQADSRHPAVGALVVGRAQSFCTATLIAPRLVLTASHCVDAFTQAGGVQNIQFRVETAQGFVYHSLIKATQHPQYNRRSNNLYDHDIAVLVLQQDITSITPIPANTQAMDSTWRGQKVLVMGYGLTQVSPTPRVPTTKQSAEIPIYQVSSNSFIHYDQQTKKSACHGDSGGPALMQIQGQWRVVGVTSVAYQANRNPRGNPATLCDGGTRDVRPDVHYQSFIFPFIQQYGGGSTGCTNGSTRPCYAGPPNTRGIGACRDGVETCQNGQWGACTGFVMPEASDQCGDKIDNNCDGQVDENCPSCPEGTQQACYTGPPNTRGIGTCRDGIQVCQGGQWGACANQQLPAAQETCFDQLDNNCNGQVDEGCPDCQDGATQACYTGPASSHGVGACRSGTQTCQGGVWGSCLGQVLPAAQETCGDQLDNNCNGQVDEGCVQPECRTGETQSCYPGAPGTLNIGLCRAGIQFCSEGAWSSCTGMIIPSPEVCDGFDNNCDGQVDEICQKTQSNDPLQTSTFRPRGFGCGALGSFSLMWWLLGALLSMGWQRRRYRTLSLT